MKDVEKTSVERETSSKRIRRRKRPMSLYMFIVLLSVAIIGVTISSTFLFNINKMFVDGDAVQYTADDVIAASGANIGDNLLRLDVNEIEQNIFDNLLYIENAKVHKSFPSSLEITVTQCVPAFNLVCDIGTLVVSRHGKILENNGFITEGLPVFYGYDPKEVSAGKGLVSNEAKKDLIFSELSYEILNNSDNNIVSVDMNDMYDTNITYSNGIIFKMGNWNDIQYKLTFAKEVMKELGDVKGYLSMIGNNQCSFRHTDKRGFDFGILGADEEPDILDDDSTVTSQPVSLPDDELLD